MNSTTIDVIEALLEEPLSDTRRVRLEIALVRAMLREPRPNRPRTAQDTLAGLAGRISAVDAS